MRVKKYPLQEMCNRLLDLLEVTSGGRKVGKLEYDEASQTLYLGSRMTEGVMLNVKGLDDMGIIQLVLNSLDKIKK